jgi:hypothetical protein
MVGVDMPMEYLSILAVTTKNVTVKCPIGDISMIYRLVLLVQGLLFILCLLKSRKFYFFFLEVFEVELRA